MLLTSYLYIFHVFHMLFNLSQWFWELDANCSHEWNSVSPFHGKLTHLGIFRAWKQTHNYWFPSRLQ